MILYEVLSNFHLRFEKEKYTPKRKKKTKKQKQKRKKMLRLCEIQIKHILIYKRLPFSCHTTFFFHLSLISTVPFLALWWSATCRSQMRTKIANRDLIPSHTESPYWNLLAYESWISSLSDQSVTLHKIYSNFSHSTPRWRKLHLTTRCLSTIYSLSQNLGLPGISKKLISFTEKYRIEYFSSLGYISLDIVLDSMSLWGM